MFPPLHHAPGLVASARSWGPSHGSPLPLGAVFPVTYARRLTKVCLHCYLIFSVIKGRTPLADLLGLLLCLGLVIKPPFLYHLSEVLTSPSRLFFIHSFTRARTSSAHVHLFLTQERTQGSENIPPSGLALRHHKTTHIPSIPTLALIPS